MNYLTDENDEVIIFPDGTVLTLEPEDEELKEQPKG